MFLISFIRRRQFTSLWERLYRTTLVGLNYWASSFNSSGEKEAIASIASALRGVEKPVIFDVGANVGEFSHHCQEAFGPKCRIYAFEPASTTFAELVKLTQNSCPSVEAFRLGISEKEGTAVLHSSEPCSTIASLVALERPIRPFDSSLDEDVEVTTIEAFCAKKGIDRIHFLKLDIEGHELAALKGAQTLLSEGRIDYVQFEFGENNISSRTFLGDFVKLLAGYDLFRIVPGGPVPWTYRGGASELFATMNYLAVRR